ncbi:MULTISPECIES: hypothetical protein [unclassified Lysobacter]|nr:MULTISPECIES: hypothetical protein [unclassified Lysobacter]MBT2750066.1 hypothetical protein [Lysobacter sp. ISL-50]MBT2775362.1 hypothetical protein [Lysobacter sp. ISL-54]MBT2783485.1 hypothetical protein [Lysobacter sp. ISL-52]
MHSERTKALFQEHLACWKAGDVDGLMKDFHPEGFIISGHGVSLNDV